MKGELPIASGYAQLEELPEIPAWRGGNSTAPAATPTSPAAPLHLYGSAPAPAASAPAPSPDGGPPPSLALQSSLENESTQKKIKQLELKLLRRRDLYTFAGDHYQFLYRMLTIPTIILTASTGLVSAAWSEAPCSCGESGEPESDGESLSRTVAVSGLSAIATVLVSVNSLLKSSRRTLPSSRPRSSATRCRPRSASFPPTTSSRRTTSRSRIPCRRWRRT